MDNIQQKYRANWNEVGPEELTDEQIYKKHMALIDQEAFEKLKSFDTQPYFLIDPFDHLYNPGQCIIKYNSDDWEDKEPAKLHSTGLEDPSVGEKQGEDILYPDVWNKSLSCIFQNKIKSKFSKKSK